MNHASVTNAFNLADDIVEPFRPFVDRLSYSRNLGRAKDDELTIEDRRAMAGILMQDCRVVGEAVSLLVATEKAAEGLVRAIEGTSPALLALPRFEAMPDIGA